MTGIRIALFFADGRAYFVGIALLIIALLVPTIPQKRRIGVLEGPLVVVGLLFVVLSSTAPLWFYATGALAIAAIAAIDKRPQVAMRWRKLGRGAAVLLCVVAAVLEASHRLMPAVEPPCPKTVYVIGDSLSAGLTSTDVTWPKVLRAQYSLEIADLSRAGATVESALTQARQVQPGPAVVILEIGGNDLLGSTSAHDFEGGLVNLLNQVRAADHQVLMFELPLPPFRHSYGWIQRRLASEFGVKLIPKSVLAGVIAGPEGTCDGLHLSDAGHRAIAETVRSILRKPATQPGA